MKPESTDPAEGKAAALAQREIRTCPACGTKFSAVGDREVCPVCALLAATGHDSAPAETLSPAAGAESSSAGIEPASIVRRFENYEVMLDRDGKPVELGRGAMGITYKAFDTDLRCPVTLKVISEQYVGDESARLRFLREARAAAKVRHTNVASVLHLGRTGNGYFYAMEFVEGETLEKLIRRSGQLEVKLALEIAAQVVAGLAAVQKQKLVHRDIKPSNIIVALEPGGAVTAKIIDLGLAKGVAEPPTESAISTPGAFAGTPAFASPEQFSWLGLDIRSDLYSLGVTLWEMLTGQVPFLGSPAEVMQQHLRAPLPLEQLKGLPQPVVVLLEVLLEKEPAQRFQDPTELVQALPRVTKAIDSGRRLTADELRSGVADSAEQPRQLSQPSKSARASARRHFLEWLLVALVGGAGLLAGWFWFSGHGGLSLNQRGAEVLPTEKSIAVLPFESLSPNKDDSYFADGVQDEILNNLAKIAQLKVISRTSVMQYRGDAKRDLRQIAAALGVANVLGGTVRRDGNHVRVSTELVDARDDNTIWADSYDRDLTDIFAIQSEVAQTVAGKLSATLSPAEKKTIEAKLTDNLDAYDLYLRGKERLLSGELSLFTVGPEFLMDAAVFFEKAVRLDPKFTVAYCESEDAYDLIYFWYDPSPEWLAKADKAVSTALRLQPDLPEVRLANARHLYRVYRDYDGALAELALARRSLPNNAGADYYEALVDNRQGRVEQTIEKLNEAITRDPRNPVYLHELATTLSVTRQFRAAEQAFDRLIELQPDHPTLKLEKPVYPSWKMEMTLQFGQQLELCRRRLPALAMLSLGNSPTPWWIVIGIKQPNSSKR